MNIRRRCGFESAANAAARRARSSFLLFDINRNIDATDPLGHGSDDPVLPTQRCRATAYFFVILKSPLRSSCPQLPVIDLPSTLPSTV